MLLPAGQCANVIVDQRGIDVVAQLLNPDGKLIAEFDSERRKYGREDFLIAPDAPANYQLKIKARYARASAAAYQIRVSMRPATEKDRFIFEAHRMNTQSAELEDQGKYDEAIIAAQNALASGQKALGPDDAFVGYLLFHLASLSGTKGEYAKSDQMFQDAIAIDERSVGREDPQTAVALRGLGRSYMARSEYSKAEPLLQESLDILERTLGREDASVALSLRMIANLHGYREDLERSAADLQRALTIAEKVFDPDDISLIAIVHDLGNVYEVMGEADRAEPLVQRALTWVEKRYGPEHPQTSAPLHNLGAIAFQKHQYQRALELYSRAMAVREKSLGSRHPQTVELMINIGNVYNCLGQYGKALEFHQRALDILSSTAGPQYRSVWTAVEAIARTYAAQGNITAAVEYQTRFEELLEKHVSRNLASGSEREKLAYFTWASSQVDRTISLHVLRARNDQGARDLAALSLLRHKGRVLDAMSASIGALRARMNEEDRKLLDNLGENNARLAKLALRGPGKAPENEYVKQIAALEDQTEKLESAVSARSEEFRAQSQAVTLPLIRAAIPSKAALIEFGAFRPFDPRGNESADAYEKPRYIAYIIRRQGEVEWAELGPVKEIDQAVTALREALRDNGRTDVKALARALDQRIMLPVRKRLGDATHLLISPDGSLNLIPFDALVDEHGQYLLERYCISYLTSGRDLLRLQVERASKNPPLVLADPLFGEPGLVATVSNAIHAQRRSVTTGQDLSAVYFAPLSSTAEEARGIQALFPEASVLTGSNASKLSLRSVSAPRILHIATHGFFLNDADLDKHFEKRVENPLLRSGLALAGANLNKSGTENGILTALEASNLDLWGTKVVTLSACETGVGEVRNGEGVYGLRRSFFLAGTETLVMSLWPVSDRVTREMMLAYYSGLKLGQGRGEALRQAELSMLKRKGRRHPFFWAGFIQSGQWKSLDGN